MAAFKRTRTGVFNPAEMKYLNCMCSPFDPNSNGARICDDFSSRSRPGVLTVEGTHIVPASGIVTLLMLLRGGLGSCIGNGSSLSIYDNEMPVATNEVNFDQDIEYDALIGAVRIVGAGLKVWSTSSDMVTQGSITGGNVNLVMQTGAAAWTTGVNMENAMDERESFLAKQGITVRWQPVEEDDTEFATLAGGEGYSINEMRANPCVVCRGWAVGETIYYKAVVHIEIRSTTTSLTPETDSPFGANINLLMATANAFPSVVSGHSFLKWAKFAVKAAGVASQLLAGGAAVVGPLIATL